MNYKDLDIFLSALNHIEPDAENPIEIVERLQKAKIPFENYLIIKEDKNDDTGYSGNGKPLHLLLRKLSSDDYIDCYNAHEERAIDHKYIINYNGVEFLNNTWYPYRNRPYAQKRAIAITKRIWNVAKIIAIIANAVMIVWLMGRAVYIDINPF